MKSNAEYTSSSHLMHFVGKKEYLVKILNHDFYPRLCCEDSIKPFFKSDVYVPMKCFSDLPMKHLEKHIKTYGRYGIGFKKSWGVKTGLTPVIYYNEKSPYIKTMRLIYNMQIKELNNSVHDSECLGVGGEIAEKIRILKSSFTMYKPVYGSYRHNNVEYGDNYCFYDEREWRYLLPSLGKTLYFQGDNLEPKIFDVYNGVEKDGKWIRGILQSEQIDFSCDDIDFVIIPDSCDVEEIVEELRNPKDEVEKIKNKIKTIGELIR